MVKSVFVVGLHALGNYTILSKDAIQILYLFRVNMETPLLL